MYRIRLRGLLRLGTNSETIHLLNIWKDSFKGISPAQGFYLHRTTRGNKETRGHTSVPRAEFESTIPGFE
jgi:hypothetical protein